MPIQLLAITPPTGTPDPERVDAWVDAAQGRKLALLLRTPDAGPEQTLADARFSAIREACERAAVPVLLSCAAADAQRGALLCKKEGLAGLQLRGDPGPYAIAAAREFLGQRILGRSVHEEPSSAGKTDYACVAPVFAPRTGEDKVAAGVDLVRQWSDTGAHVIALGGITADNAQSCVEAGARGLASISAFFDDPPEVVRALAGFLEPPTV